MPPRPPAGSPRRSPRPVRYVGRRRPRQAGPSGPVQGRGRSRRGWRWWCVRRLAGAPLACSERVGLRAVDREDLRQPGDAEDLEQSLLVADQPHRAVVRPDLLQATHEYTEARGVEEVHLLHVDDEVVASVADKFGDLVAELRCGVDVDLSTHLDDGVTILVARLQ